MEWPQDDAVTAATSPDQFGLPVTAHAAPHSHDQVEHVYVLEGSFSDEYGTYHAGDYLVRSPGSDHSAQTERGATVLLMYTRP